MQGRRQQWHLSSSEWPLVVARQRKGRSLYTSSVNLPVHDRRCGRCLQGGLSLESLQVHSQLLLEVQVGKGDLQRMHHPLSHFGQPSPRHYVRFLPSTISLCIHYSSQQLSSITTLASLHTRRFGLVDYLVWYCRVWEVCVVVARTGFTAEICMLLEIVAWR